jgi:hypothetical protein
MDHLAPTVAEAMPYDAEAAALGTKPIPAALAPGARTRRVGFAGFTYGQLAMGVFVIAVAIWGMWATSKIIALQDRRVVSVRLASIVNDFVSAEARSGTPPEQLGVQTRAFMTALDGVLKKRADRGEVVLVGEAVVASSVPDVTAEVVAALARIIKLPSAAAMPPAIKPLVTEVPQVSPVIPSVPATPDGATSEPFGPAPAQPLDAAPAQ